MCSVAEYPNTKTLLPHSGGQQSPFLTHRGPKGCRHSSCSSCRDEIPLLRVSAKVLEDLGQDNRDASAWASDGTSLRPGEGAQSEGQGRGGGGEERRERNPK